MATAATALLAPSGLLRPRAARAAGAEPVLVVLFLRGGADWLTLVPPIDDDRYYAIRPRLSVPRASALGLDGFFGLHPDLAPLLKHYRSGRLAVLHAFGSPDDTRSHFEAQAVIETADPFGRPVPSGWLGRYAAQAGLAEPWSSLTLGSIPARALAGAPSALAFPSMDKFNLPGQRIPERRQTLGRLANVHGGDWGRAASNALAALDEIAAVRLSPRVTWPDSELAEALRDLSLLIRARIGVRVAAVDMGGWDHHFDQLRRMPVVAGELAAALDAFVADLGAELDRTLVLVLTEFGRRAIENGSGGAEHGRGSALFALGGAVRGGRVLLRDGRWPGLGENQLLQGRDLAVTTDFRDVFAEVLRRHMGVSDLAPIFPAFSVATTRFPGLLA